MQNVVAKISRFSKSQPDGMGKICIGKIINVSLDGHVIVDYDSNPGEPVEARSAISIPSHPIDINIVQFPVLLVFENNDPKRPIIIGFVHEALFPQQNNEGGALPVERSNEAIIDGKRIVFDAEKEILLRCGKSSVLLKANGSVIIKGTKITSRAAKTNRIKGATVNIN